MIHLLKISVALLLALRPVGKNDFPPDCDQLIRKLTDKSAADRKLAREKGFLLEGKVSVSLQKGGTNQLPIIVRAGRGKYYMMNGGMEMFLDDAAVVVVDHREKSIFLTSPLPESTREKQFENILVLQDSLLRYFKVNKCDREWGTVLAGVGLQRIEMKPSEERLKKEVQSVSYWVDADKLEIHKIGIYYATSASSGLKSYELELSKMRVEDQSCFDGSALSKVMTGTKVRSEWEGYRMTDKRKKKF